MPNETKELKVLFVSTEVTPFAKSGGLGDVAGALPKELIKQGVDVRVVFPKYKTIKEETLTNLTYLNSLQVVLGWRRQSASIFTIEADVKTYLIQNDFYFGRDGFYGYGDDYERFAFFTKAALEFLTMIDFQPDIIHFNDWQTGLGSVYLKGIYQKFTFYQNMKTLFTVHNLQYQGIFGRNVLSEIDLNDGYFVNDKLEFFNNINFMKAGLVYADAINTVSETYANEIQTSQYGYGLDGVLRSRYQSLCGIVNGIDYDVNNPETDKRIVANYSVKDMKGKAENKEAMQKELGLPVRGDVPMFGIVSRLVDQKGFDIIADAMHELLQRDLQVVILGTGDGRYEHMFRYFAQTYPQKVSANICFHEKLAQNIYAGSDFFLMPSLFEPCGLGQLLAMRYGTLPIVRKTGGLADTVQHFNQQTGEGNGFVFEHYMGSAIIWAVDQALLCYNNKAMMSKAIKNAMTCDFSWHRSAERYIELYRSLMGYTV